MLGTGWDVVNVDEASTPTDVSPGEGVAFPLHDATTTTMTAAGTKERRIFTHPTVAQGSAVPRVVGVVGPLALPAQQRAELNEPCDAARNPRRR